MAVFQSSNLIDSGFLVLFIHPGPDHAGPQNDQEHQDSRNHVSRNWIWIGTTYPHIED